MGTISATLLAVKAFLSPVFTFLSKPPGSYLAAAGAVCLALWWFGQHEYNRGEAACEATHAAAAAKEATRQQAAGNGAVAASEARSAAHVKQDAANKDIVDAIKADAAKLPPPPAGCPAAIPPDIAARLRQIR